MSSKKALLVILDGWGLGQKSQTDAIAAANTPVFDNIWKNYPHSTLTTFGEEVGLPGGQMGNSEVGHLNIGAGRVVYQELARINKALSDGSLAQNTVLLNGIQYAKENNKAIHLMGLVSDGGVHSHINHLLGLIDIIENSGVSKIYIHAFTDGRDTAPKGGIDYLQKVQNHIEGKHAQLASITGRYFAMDRDNRWDRIQLTYKALTNGEGELTKNALAVLQERYEKGETDEFITPIIQLDKITQQPNKMEAGDVVLSFNFRTDRPRQITAALTQQDFPDFQMTKLPLRYLTMTRYDNKFSNIEALFEKDDLQETIGETVSKAGKTQVRIAETEKYAHVTFFLNGGREEPFENEKRLLIPSPQDVATYDLKPEMSANGITDAIIEEMNKNAPDFICLNYANTDMVGHTGIWGAAIKAAETVDECLGRLLTTAKNNDYEAIVIADHGNADIMVKEDGSPHTAHTTNLVPCIYIHQQPNALEVKSGKLADVAPTLLNIMGISPPKLMTGQNLITSSKVN